MYSKKYSFILSLLFACISCSINEDHSSNKTSHYHYKAETGAYIEATRKETFTICPEKEIEGTWISEYSVALNTENCLSVQAPNLAGTFRVLFMESNGLTDTIQVLVDQSYIQMGDYSHRIWVTDFGLKYDRCYSTVNKEKYEVICCYSTGDVTWCDTKNSEENGHYENRKYSQPLIVDKTKFTMGDALYYSKISDVTLSHFTLERDEYKNKKLEESNLPLMNVGIYEAWHFANERSKKEGLDTAYIILKPNSKLALDTLASGYRIPFEEEWFLLMHAGTSTRYYWGNEEDSRTVSRYEWVKPIDLKPVAQKRPNGFGLYDMAGIANEYGAYCDFSPECLFIKEIRAREEIYDRSLRLLRKTPKLHKLEKF